MEREKLGNEAHQDHQDHPIAVLVVVLVVFATSWRTSGGQKKTASPRWTST